MEPQIATTPIKVDFVTAPGKTFDMISDELADLFFMAAKQCRHPEAVNVDTFKNVSKEVKHKTLANVFNSGHLSVFEHQMLTWVVTCDCALTHQLVRHRIASYTQQSKRYSDENMMCVTPPEFMDNPKLRAGYEKRVAAIFKQRDEYKAELLEEGFDEQKARELSRGILPFGVSTSIVVSMNLRSAVNFFDHRCCNRAQAPIKTVADAMYEDCRKIFPYIFTTERGRHCDRYAGICFETKTTKRACCCKRG